MEKANVYVESFRYYEDARQEEMDKWWKDTAKDENR